MGLPRNTTRSMVIPWNILRGIPWSFHEKNHVCFSHGFPWGIKQGPLLCRIANVCDGSKSYTA